MHLLCPRPLCALLAIYAVHSTCTCTCNQCNELMLLLCYAARPAIATYWNEVIATYNLTAFMSPSALTEQPPIDHGTDLKYFFNASGSYVVSVPSTTRTIPQIAGSCAYPPPPAPRSKQTHKAQLISLLSICVAHINALEVESLTLQPDIWPDKLNAVKYTHAANAGCEHCRAALFGTSLGILYRLTLAHAADMNALLQNMPCNAQQGNSCI